MHAYVLPVLLRYKPCDADIKIRISFFCLFHVKKHTRRNISISDEMRVDVARQTDEL